MIKREGTKFIKEFDGKKEFIVSMIEFNDTPSPYTKTILVATNICVYKMVDEKLTPIKIEVENNEPR